MPRRTTVHTQRWRNYVPVGGHVMMAARRLRAEALRQWNDTGSEDDEDYLDAATYILDVVEEWYAIAHGDGAWIKPQHWPPPGSGLASPR